MYITEIHIFFHSSQPKYKCMVRYVEDNDGRNVFVVDQMLRIDVAVVRHVVSAQPVIVHDELVHDLDVGRRQHQMNPIGHSPEHWIVSPPEPGHFSQGYVLVGVGRRASQLIRRT